MKKVLVGSLNPVKVNATKEAFEAMLPKEAFEFIGYKANSGVSDQPMTYEETRQGAQGRITDMKSNTGEADYYVSIEGGIEEKDESLFTAAAVIIVAKDGLTGKAMTAEVQLPPRVSELVKSGIELGHANDEVFGKENSKHSSGATGLLTDGLLERTEFYKQALILALVPFKNRHLYEN